MGALGIAPGPWLERAARNGLYDYTDAINFHFYGHARDLAGVIEAQRNAARPYAADREMPLWITECGTDTTPEGQPDDPAARERQRRFVLQTARAAMLGGVRVFMPFILVAGKGGDGFALLKSADEPYPAWTAYSRFTRRHSLPAGPALAPPKSPSRVVLQWLPDNATCTPHKVGGTYWFHEDDAGATPIEGRVIAYNFSNAAIEGFIDAKPGDGLRIGKANFGSKLEIPPLGRVSIPLAVEPAVEHYVRGEIEMTFRESGQNAGSSRLVFAFERRPDDRVLPRQLPLEGRRPRFFEWIWEPEPYRISSRGGPWLGVNGVKVGDGDAAETHGVLGKSWRFQMSKRQTDPRFPPMAITKVDGLPAVADGFLRLRVGQKPGAATGIRVDLVDINGQRFSVAENFGQDWLDANPAKTFLSYRDFNLYGWGRCLAHPAFHPSNIREIQLRFYPQFPFSPVDVRLDVVAPVEAGNS
jgi:hypothetical protein